MRQHRKGVFKGDQITRIRCLVGNAADDPFQIINRGKIFPHFFSRHQILIDLCDRVLSCDDRFLVHQRLFYVLAQGTGSHRRLGLVKHPE